MEGMMQELLNLLEYASIHLFVVYITLFLFLNHVQENLFKLGAFRSLNLSSLTLVYAVVLKTSITLEQK